MSINPVQGVEASQVLLVEARARHEQPPSPVRARAQQPDSGTLPKQNIRVPGNAAASFEMHQDEVQVQRDSETNGVIVIKYLDHSGSVVLQVPSPQVLGIMRAIDQDFAEKAKARLEQADNEGANLHGH